MSGNSLGSAFKISLRTLYREKRYAAINILGLSLAIACSLVLALYLRSELTYDRHFENYQNIYRVVNEFTINDQVDRFAATSPILGPLLVEDNPNVEAAVRFQVSNNEVALTYQDLTFSWENTAYVSDNVFEVFSHDIIYGDPQTALDEPYTVALSESVSRAYFGNENPLGRVLTNEGGQPYTITLVFADLPENTHYRYTLLFSRNIPRLADPDNPMQRNRSLMGINSYTYVKMREGYDPDNWPAFSDTFFANRLAELVRPQGISFKTMLEPLARVHLHSDMGYDQPKGNVYYVYAFIVVSVFMLVIASINYMNLSTARSAKRAREVGMRKILGSNRAGLIVQFMSESVLYAMLAFVVAIVIVEVALTLTPLNSLLGKPLALSMTGEPLMVAGAAALCLAVGLLSGLYPALYLSSWQPLTALVGNQKSGTGGTRFRSTLVFVQFTITVTVIACTLLMGSQMRYVSDKTLGFRKENQVMITLRGADTIEQFDAIRNELMGNSSVLGVSASTARLGEVLSVNIFSAESEEGHFDNVSVYNMSVEQEFVEVMGLDLLQGRSFATRLLTDVGRNVIVNQAMVDHMGWSEPLGKRVLDGRVIGVVANFHYASLHTPIEPFVMVAMPDDLFANAQPEARPFATLDMVVSVSGENLRDTLAFIGDTMRRFDPVHPFEFRFFDEQLNELYQSEERLLGLVGIFSLICISISCLGLYGLAAFSTEQRTKEIGIRKVLGATSTQIITLLARSILALVVAGAVIASLASYLVIDEWLSGFAYRVSINPLIFLVATLIALLIAYVTVAIQSFRTAQSDPALSLRHE